MKGMPFLAEIFKDVQHMHNPHYKSKHPDVPFRNKPSAGDPRYAEELARVSVVDAGFGDVGLTLVVAWPDHVGCSYQGNRGVGYCWFVKLIIARCKCVFFFLILSGSLGTPRISWLEKLGLQSSASKAMGFYNTRLSDCIENAFQALALDERRTSFSPALWEKAPGNMTRLRQVWFPGAHSNVGGGYNDQELANITLAWMMSQIRPFLDLHLDYLLDQKDASDRYYERTNQRIRPWSFGEIYNSMTGIWAIGGATTRTPGRYFAVDPNTGRETDWPLSDTCEYIHPSVRTRLKFRGPGIDDRGEYRCPALMKDWKLVVDYPENSEYFDDNEEAPKRGARPRTPDVFWKLRTKQTNVTTRILPESPLWPLERELLELDPDIEEHALNPSAVVEGRSRGGGSSSGTTRGRRERRSVGN